MKLEGAKAVRRRHLKRIGADRVVVEQSSIGGRGCELPNARGVGGWEGAIGGEVCDSLIERTSQARARTATGQSTRARNSRHNQWGGASMLVDTCIHARSPLR